MFSELSNVSQQKLIKFIEMNDLDYQVIDNGISRFHVTSYDGKTFTFYESQDQFVLVEYDKDLEQQNKPAFKYHNFNSLSQLFEAMSKYDNQLHKVYWQPIMSDALHGVKDYEKEWYKGLLENYQEDQDKRCLIYEDFNYKPEITSPFNTLHQVSPINTRHIEKMDRLYFEIHPISCNEQKYIAKILCNMDKKFPEYVNYMIWTKKGLKKFIESLFNDMKQFKINELYDKTFSENQILNQKREMRFKDYYDTLKRDFESTYREEDVDKIWQLLKKDSRPFLNEIKKTGSDLLFRGYYDALDNNAGYGIDKKRVRKNRTAKDMNPLISNEFDNFFYERFGYELRKESVFTCKNPLTTFTYSGIDQTRKRKQTFIFFPIGDYEYFWNPDIEDLYSDLDKESWYYEIGGDMEKLTEYSDEIKKIVDGYQYGNIEKVNDQEISFVCDWYYLVDDAFLFEILKKIENEI